MLRGVEVKSRKILGAESPEGALIRGKLAAEHGSLQVRVE